MASPITFKFSPVNIEERRKLDVRLGDTVRVHQKIVEKGKTRLQMYEGLLIAHKHGREPGATITVRKTASGVGMERIFPLYSPMIQKIEVVKRSKVRRAKLYHIRTKAAKEVARKMKQLRGFAAFSHEDSEEKVEEAPIAEEATAEPATAEK